MTKNEFLEIVSKLVVEENNRRGKPLFASVVIAQAICESGWGQSQIMMKANAIFGIKATASWKGKVYNANTKECYDGVSYTNINACFRAYNSLAESIADYFDLITKAERYRKACVANNPLECITAIKNGGYATSPTYINTIMSIINSNNLTKYDVDNVENPVDNSVNVDIEQLARVNEILGYSSKPKNDNINVGDKVKVLNATQYNGQTFKKYYDVYDVIEVKGDRVVIGIGQTVTCAININNIRKV